MKYPRQWLQDRFFKGFLAVLAQRGHQFVETLDGDHQRRFDLVAHRLAELQQQDRLDRFPKSFVRSSITGVYKDLDDALIALQNGLLSAQNPYYVSVSINCPREVADEIVRDFSGEEQRVLNELVRTWENRQHQLAA